MWIEAILVSIGRIASQLQTNVRCLGNAKLQGLITQLDLTGNRYNIVLVRGDIANLTISITEYICRLCSTWCVTRMTRVRGQTLKVKPVLLSLYHSVEVRLPLGVAATILTIR